MKSQVAFCALLTLLLTLSASAQRGGGKPGGGVTSVPSRPRPSGLPDLTTTPNNVFLSGKVVVDDGTPLTEGAAIQTICKGQKRTETHTDSRGNFSFEFSGRSRATSTEIGDADSTMWNDPTSNRRNQRTISDCELQASLPGFTSEVIELSQRTSGLESNDVGRIVLHRLGQVEGLTISATSAAAPDAARKAYEKGLKQENKNKWDEAQQSFDKAVTIYAKYAVAWFELGRVQLRNKDADGARHSFAQALAADSKFISPYQALAQMAANEKQWQTVVDLTNQVLALNPLNFPDAWFLNSAGYYFLQNFASAEKSVRQGMKLDEEHRFPKMEYLLGMILVQKHDYTEAATHMRRFLALATNPPDVEEAKKQLAEIERLSPSASVPTVADKK
jgi:tetratricopeptide (TPR) repeat protein